MTFDRPSIMSPMLGFGFRRLLLSLFSKDGCWVSFGNELLLIFDLDFYFVGMLGLFLRLKLF